MDKRVKVVPKNNWLCVDRVGIYCRVSTPTNAQLHSFSAQASYLTRYVASKPGWYLVDIYLDVGSGSSSSGRPEYNRMLNDANCGKLDIILVKSISRLGRDTESILSATRSFTEKGVAVFFEEQGIDTRSTDSELYISIYGAVAQAENYNISENIKWGIQKKIEDGTSAIYDRPCYGYQSTENDHFEIVTEQAAVVRRIFNSYLDGMSIIKIKAALESEGILSPSGKQIWNKHTIELILTNKKYCGYAVAYKTYFQGEPKPKRKINKGEHIMAEIENHHKAIVPLELFEKVQKEKVLRSNVEIGDDGIARRKTTKYSAIKHK